MTQCLFHRWQATAAGLSMHEGDRLWELRGPVSDVDTRWS
jgi:hypothetical protein